MTPPPPRVSIIMPVYNAADTLRQSLEDLCGQRYSRFEVLCVDDGSVDDSRMILEEYAARDCRFFTYSQNHQYAGAARNLGIQHARGEYLLFLDADDRFHPDLLEASLTQIEKQHADICIFRAESLDEISLRRQPLKNTLDLSHAPAEVFTGKEMKQYLFSLTNPAPWNKLFRTEFVRNQGLTFQGTRNSNDLAFVLSALAAAERITVLDRILLSYRVNNAQSVQGSKGKEPLDFYKALLELRERLRKYGHYEDLKPAFLNFCAYNIVFNLNSAARPEIFEALYSFIRQQGLKELELQNLPNEFFCVYPEEELAARLNTIQKESILDYVGKYGPDFGIVQQRMSASTFKKTVFFQLKRSTNKIRSLLKA